LEKGQTLCPKNQSKKDWQGYGTSNRMLLRKWDAPNSNLSTTKKEKNILKLAISKDFSSRVSQNCLNK
jgi:hypothetical protein